MTSDSVCQEMSDKHDSTCILAFSRGKDAIGAWLQLRRYFSRIIPFHMILLPDLSFVTKSLEYYADFFKTEILTVPHEAFFRWIENSIFHPPHYADLAETIDIPQWSYEDNRQIIIEEMHLPDNIFVADGVRMNDSIYRRIALKKYGPVRHKVHKFSPIFDWSSDKLYEEIKQSGCKLPVDYKMFGRTFDGLDYRFIAPIKERFPDDYERIREIFPLCELEFLRRMA